MRIKKTSGLLLGMILVLIFSTSPDAFAAKQLPSGGGYDVTCGDLGIQMRDGKTVRSCLLGLPGDFPYGYVGQSVPCAAKYAAAFRKNGDIEYCTLGLPAVFPRTPTETVACRPGARTTFRENGMVESCALGADVALPWRKDSTVACKGWFPAAFRPDGNVSTCVLGEDSVFVTGKKKTYKNCKAGGLIAFDEDGTFSGCYPQPPPKTPVPPADTSTTTKPGGNEP